MSEASLVDALLRGLYERRCVSITYDGFSRIVEPYAVGISTAGNPVIRIWQVSGGSRSGQGTGWKLLEIHKISNASVTDAIFQPIRQGYSRDDSGMSRVYHNI